MENIKLPGMRTVKTAIAVFICLIVDKLLLKTGGVFSSMSAVICMLPTADETFKKSIDRFLGTTFGCAMGAIALVIYNIFPEYTDILKLFIVPFFILIMIQVCNMFNRPGIIALVTTIFISLALTQRTGVEIVSYTLLRLLETFVGISSAYLINTFVMNPARRAKPLSDIKEATAEDLATKDELSEKGD